MQIIAVLQLMQKFSQVYKKLTTLFNVKLIMKIFMFFVGINKKWKRTSRAKYCWEGHIEGHEKLQLGNYLK